MNREIKFRAWDKRLKEMVILDNVDWEAGHQFFTDERYIPMQFTGLHDKNGKKIWEGDIVENDLGEKGEVKWEAGGFDWGDNFSIGKGDVDEIWVIGNVFENPELLKEDN